MKKYKINSATFFSIIINAVFFLSFNHILLYNYDMIELCTCLGLIIKEPILSLNEEFDTNTKIKVNCLQMLTSTQEISTPQTFDLIYKTSGNPCNENTIYRSGIKIWFIGEYYKDRNIFVAHNLRIDNI